MKASKDFPARTSFPPLHLQFAKTDPYSRHSVWKGCERKDNYPDEGTATWHANRRMREGSAPLRVYFCPNCGKWHMAKRK